VKLTDTQLVLLSAASRRDDHALERPSNLTGGAAGKVVARLLADGLIEEINPTCAVLDRTWESICRGGSDRSRR
jgi:hypothetical protein